MDYAVDGAMCRDIHTKFHKCCFMHSKVNRGDKHTDTDTRKHTQTRK
jgi:hypothetical protein